MFNRHAAAAFAARHAQRTSTHKLVLGTCLRGMSTTELVNLSSLMFMPGILAYEQHCHLGYEFVRMGEGVETALDRVTHNPGRHLCKMLLTISRQKCRMRLWPGGQIQACSQNYAHKAGVMAQRDRARARRCVACAGVSQYAFI